MPRDMSLWSLG